jgi:hypothetical protein
MRAMEIRSFPRQIHILDLENFFSTRLSSTIVMWPDQAISLLGYMCHPNDNPAREKLMGTIRSWHDPSGSGRPPVPEKLGRIQADWLKVADIFHHYCDLIEGGHQERRGGPSIGKAITLVAANAKSWGTKEANLWKLWGVYKDVAHLVTSAALICAEVRNRLRNLPPDPAGLGPTQFVPFQMTLLMPDLILAVAKEFEAYGLGVSEGRLEPAFDSDTVWRLPADINIVPLPPPIRKLRPQDKVVLNNRRAGNRGGLIKPNESMSAVGGKADFDGRSGQVC